jgi:Arc/MetJ family transcription regulator
LTDAYYLCIIIHIKMHMPERGEVMRTTLNIEEKLVKKAAMLTGVKEKTSLVRLGLQALIAMESGKRLASLGGTEKGLKPIPRRRPEGR